jgi:colicin import membrane protein
MIAMLGQHSGSVSSSIALHVAILAALAVSFRWSLSSRVTAVPAPIQGVMVDPAALQKEQQRREQDAQRKQRDERQRRELIEQQQREKEAADKRERDRVATEQRQREQAEAAKREQEKVAKQKAEQEAREKQAREDAARKQKEALETKQKAQAEAQLAAEIAAENAHNEAVRSGVLDEYIRAIQDKIERNWSPPLSAKTGLECVVNVVQLPTGDVYDAKVDASHCNGDEAVRMSIEAAVKKASPLPKPPSQAVFERNLIVTFKPAI